MSLSERLRPDIEAAPWVIEEVKALEAEIERLKDMEQAYLGEVKLRLELEVEVERLRAFNAVEIDRSRQVTRQLRAALLPIAWRGEISAEIIANARAALAGTGSISKPEPGWDERPVEDGCVRGGGGKGGWEPMGDVNVVLHTTGSGGRGGTGDEVARGGGAMSHPSDRAVLTEGLRNETLEAEVERLRAAAQAVVERWHTPLWKDVEATAAVINRLERALEPPQP